MVFSCLAFLFGYTLGSVPFGYIVVRWKLGRDIRELGSGNIGATNVARVLGKRWGRVVLGLDILKGLLAVLIAGGLLGKETALFAGLGAVVGHMFPLYIGFKGGKGVATGIGILLGLGLFEVKILVVLGVGLSLWLVVYRLSGFVSLASLVMSVWLILGPWFMEIPHVYSLLLTFLGAIVVYRHRDNIRRLLKGEEKKTAL